MSLYAPLSNRTTREEPLYGYLAEQDTRLTRLERVYQGSQRAFGVVSVPTVADLPDPVLGLYAWVTSGQDWYGYSGGTWQIDSEPPS